MASHYSDIGFIFNSADNLKKFLMDIFDKGIPIRSKHGRYQYVVVDDKIEFWIHLDKRNAVLGLDFHFASNNTIPIRFDHWIAPDSNDDRLSGSIYVWYQRNGDLFPFVIDVPNADLYRKIRKNEILIIQVACFAEELFLYDSDEEYDASQGGEPKFHSEFFIPSGTFSLSDTEDKEPSANAIFSGHIKAFEKRKNSIHGLEYYYFTTECQGALFDIAADSEMIHKEPVVGGVLKGSFWMSGKIISEQK